MVAKLILDASSYQKSIQIAKAETTTIKKEMELWMVENNKTKDSLSGLVKQVKTNADTQKILSAEIAKTKQQYAETSEKMGANSAAAMKLKNNLLDMQIAQAKLSKELGGGLTHLQNFKNGLDAAATQLKKVGDGMVSAGKSLTYNVTLPLLAVGTAATKMAMDAIESENLFEISMGKNATAAREWSEGLRESLGLNEYAVRKNVSTFNVMLDSMGMGSKASYDMATGLTQLSYDMASFYNLKPEEAFEKLQSGISGEIEPLKRLGIVINETTTKTYAYSHGIAKQGEALTEQQKIQARYGAIMEATGKAQGDLARTIDSPINQIRILGEQTKQLGIDFGMLLIPIIGDLIGIAKPFMAHLKELVTWFKNLSPETQKTIGVIVGLVIALGPLLVIAGKVATGIAALAPVIAAIASPVGIVVLAIAGLVAGIIYLWKTNEDFRNGVIAIWEGIKSVAIAVFNGIKDFWAEWGGTITQIFSDIWEIIKTVAMTIFDNLKAFWETWGGAITAAFTSIWDGIKTVFTAVWETIKNIVETAINIVSNVIGLVLDLIKGDWSGAWDHIKNIAKAVWDYLSKEIGIFKDFFVGIWENIKDGVINIINGLWSGIQSIIDKVKSAIDSINIFNNTKVEDKSYTVTENRKIIQGNFTGGTSGGGGGGGGGGFAEGTNNALPGWAWTGEKGPELINFKGGESVVPNNKLGGDTIQITITGNTIANDMDINKIGDKLVSYLKSRGVKLATPY